MTPAPAMAVSAYPLFYTTTHEDGSTELHILPPFFEVRTTEDEVFWGLHPLVAEKWNRHTKKGTVHWTPPLGFSKRTPEEVDETGRSTKHIKFLFIFHWKRWTDYWGFERTDFWILPFWYSGRSEEGSSYYVLFPFFWYSNGMRQSLPVPSLGPQTYQAVFPIYGNFRNFMLLDRMVFALFPAYVYERKGSMRGHSVLWPIFGWNKADGYSSWRAWPLIGRSSFDNGRKKWYFLWPLGHVWTKPTDPEALARDDTSAQVFIPFYARVNSSRIKGWGIPLVYGRFDREGTRSRGYMPPLLVYREMDDPQFQEWNVLFLIGRYRWGSQSWVRFWPLFSKRDEGEKWGWYALWPFIQFRAERFNEYTRSIFMVVPFYYNKKWEHEVGSFDWPEGGTEKVRLLWPLWKYERLPDGSKKFNLLWLFWFRKWEAMEWNWVPIWSVYAYDRNVTTGETNWQVLRPFLWGRKTPEGRASEFNLLGIQYRNQDGTKRLGFLFRKLSVKLPF